MTDVWSRLSGGELEMGTWRVDELKSHPEFNEVFGQCQKLWEDRVLGKLGIPEVRSHVLAFQNQAQVD